MGSYYIKVDKSKCREHEINEYKYMQFMVKKNSLYLNKQSKTLII